MDGVPEITTEALIERYDVLLFDAYGVLVHGAGALPGAVALIQRLNRIGHPYYLLANDASRLPETAAKRYRGFGLAETLTAAPVPLRPTYRLRSL